MVEGIVSTLRAWAYLGEAHNVVWLCRAGDLGILEVIGKTDYPWFVPGEKRSFVIIVSPGNPKALAPTHINGRYLTDDRPTVKQQICSTQVSLGQYGTPG